MSEAKSIRSASPKDLMRLAVFLGIGLLHALLYVFLVPPWQHYDEPNHFEVIWLAANLGRFPTAEDYDPQLSRKVVQSMVENDFYKNLNGLPDLSPDVQVHIPGYTQFEEQPLYYFLASLPLKIYQSEKIENQLYAARLISVVLYLLCVFAAWGIARTLTPPGHPLRWMLPVFMILLPGFTDLMTAVNNDVLAIAAFSFFFWGCTRLLKYGYTIGNVIWVILSLAVVYFAKNTAYVAFILFPLVLVVALFPNKYRWVVWSTVVVICSLFLFFLLRFDDPASWHRTISQLDPIRQKNPQAVLGDYVLALDLWEDRNPPWAPPAYTLLPIETSRNLREHKMTLGYWIWSNQEITANSPIIGTPTIETLDRIQVNTEPTFHALHIDLPPSTARVWLRLFPKADSSQSTRLFFDGFVLADGHRPLNEIPTFADDEGTKGTWGNEPFTNYLRNGSIEKTWPRFEPHLDNLLTRVLPDRARPTLILNSLLDWPATKVLFNQTSKHLLQTFWARFGWGHVPLIFPGLYKVLAWVMAIGLFGAFVGILRRGFRTPWDWAWLSLLAVLLIWFTDFVRGVGYFTSNHLYIPTARYAYPAIIPTLVILCLGWLEIFKIMKSAYVKLYQMSSSDDQTNSKKGEQTIDNLAAGLFLGGLAYIATLSLISLLIYYQQVG